MSYPWIVVLAVLALGLLYVLTPLLAGMVHQPVRVGRIGLDLNLVERKRDADSCTHCRNA